MNQNYIHGKRKISSGGAHVIKWYFHMFHTIILITVKSIQT